VISSSVSERFSRALSSGGAGRLSIWKTAYAAFRKAWLLGSGTGNFQEAYDRSWFDVYHGTYLHWHIVAHNLIAQTAVELGGVGLALTLFAWWIQFRSLAKIESTSRYADLRITLEAATLGLLVSSLFLDIMWYKYTWEAFMLAALTHQFVRSPAAEAAPIAAPVSGMTVPLRPRAVTGQ
jgi:O-antigen ligase